MDEIDREFGQISDVTVGRCCVFISVKKFGYEMLADACKFMMR